MTRQTSPIDPPTIRDAATVILLRRSETETRVLMGQRGKKAAFMPGKFVFPGGAVDPQDYHALPPQDVERCEQDGTMPICSKRLAVGGSSAMAQAILTAARRELVEETGLSLNADAQMRFVFRAITPPKRPRRFDARFLLCDARDVVEDLDDFSRAEDELAYLQWVELSAALTLDLPFITRVVLAEIDALASSDEPPVAVPFYDHRGPIGRIVSIE